MKTVVKIFLNNSGKILVDVGDEIEKGGAVSIIGEESNEVEINLSEILKVKTGDIFKFLKKRPTEKVSEGELLAEKKSLVTLLSVRSPISGNIKEVDLKKGTVTIIKEGKQTIKVTVPVKGRVKSIEKNLLELEIKGERISALKGKGESQVAKLMRIPDEKSSFFDFGIEVENRLVLIKKVTAELMAKLDTLDALGVITLGADEEGNFPCLVISDDSYKELAKADGKSVWLRPAEKEVIILED
ncbi:hypothetical protein A2W14_04330 [Candidatus Gottesmanbacteria bacterium RBG_16_37_8]|uniref:Uncharacterized protein n=1 Tax=Candidatus Gottesmanbacteria bacterium RBG_16_37_8 TaxID=1798371 RepID=A0A1F5YS22_9BACT|nr:MAG: hypothetical protein A2W14_04330 [Candidatus Gottesmanbacteria bacterium RBG_16_37_8]